MALESQYRTIRMLVKKHGGIDVKMRGRIRYVADCRFVYYKLCEDLIKNFSPNHCSEEIGRVHSTVVTGLKECKKVFNQSDFKAKTVYNDCILDIKSNKLMSTPIDYYKEIIDMFNNFTDSLDVEYELIKP